MSLVRQFGIDELGSLYREHYALYQQYLRVWSGESGGDVVSGHTPSTFYQFICGGTWAGLSCRDVDAYNGLAQLCDGGRGCGTGVARGRFGGGCAASGVAVGGTASDGERLRVEDTGRVHGDVVGAVVSSGTRGLCSSDVSGDGIQSVGGSATGLLGGGVSQACGEDFEADQSKACGLGGCVGALPGVLGSAVGGPNLLINRAKREKKKLRKLRRQAGATGGSEPSGSSRVAGEEFVPEWRRGAGVVSEVKGSTETVGFFAGADADVRAELQRSRAARYIAENKVRAARHEQELEDLKSPVAMIQKAVAVMEKAVAMTKGKPNSKVAGWARTVTTSYAEEIVKKASPASASSEDTFESFTWSPDGSDASRTSVVKEDERELEYAEALRQLKRAFDAVDYEDPGVREAAIEDLKDKYADVVYSREKAQKIFAIAAKQELLRNLEVSDAVFVCELQKLEDERVALDVSDETESLIRFDMSKYGY